MASTLKLETVASPIGDLLVAILGDSVCAISFEGNEADTKKYLGRRFGEHDLAHGSVPARVHKAFARYFDGDMAAFEGLASGARGTPFQEQVWAALRAIPAGETRSYADQAQHIGRPTATRAVGLANGQNPVSIHGALPPRDRPQRLAHRLRRRARAQGLAVAP